MYTKNYKPLIKEIKWHKQMKRYSIFLVGRINVLKMTILPKATYRFSVIYQIINGVFHRTRTTTTTTKSTIHMEAQKTPEQS